jgi:hypothetical protein
MLIDLQALSISELIFGALSFNEFIEAADERIVDRLHILKERMLQLNLSFSFGNKDEFVFK